MREDEDMAKENANLDSIALGSAAAAVGVGAKVPAVASLISTIGAVDGTFKAGAIIATALPVAAPVLIVGGLAIVGYELFKK